MKVIDVIKDLADGKEIKPFKIGIIEFRVNNDQLQYKNEYNKEHYSDVELLIYKEWLNEEVEIIEDEFIDIEEIKLERDDILGYYNGASHRMTTNVKDREVYIKIINNLIKNQKKIIERVDK